MKRGATAYLVSALAAVAAMPTHAAPPEICRIQGGNTKLIFGVGFDPAATEVRAWSPRFEEKAILEALSAGQYKGAELLPATPPQGAKKLPVLRIGPAGRVMAVEFHRHYGGGGFYDAMAGEQVCWVGNGDGFSKPRLVHSAQPWWLFPERARPGNTVRILGRNLRAGRQGALVALKPSRGGEVVVLRGGMAVRQPMYERVLAIPSDLAPGQYQVYVHNGSGGTAGWGGPLALTVEAPTTQRERVVDARETDAKGDGFTDDTKAIQTALERAARKKPGVVLLPAGRYGISGTLAVPPGVSLRGVGAGNTIIEVSEARAMREDFPKAAALEGYARDWLPHMRGHGYAPMVWLRNRSAVSDLMLRSGPGVGMGVLVARCPGVAEHVGVERCHIRMTHREGYWVNAAPVRVAGPTYGLSIRDCQMEGHGGVDVISTSNRQAYVGSNTMRGLPHGLYNMMMLRGFVDSVIENNVVRDGERAFVCQLGQKLGKHELPEGKNGPAGSFYHTILLGNMFHNTIPRRHNAGETMYEGGGPFWQGRPVSVGGATLTVEGQPFWTDMTDTYVLVLDGHGLGQYRRVVSNTKNTLTVSPPWEVAPDTSTYLTVNGFFADTLWVDNTEEHTANWTGFWGNNVGHVVDGHVLRDGAGFYLWGFRNDAPTPVAFNDIVGSRVIGRGNINFIGTLVFANTVRFCEVVDFRHRPGFHIVPYWLGNYQPDRRAGIDLGPVRHKMDHLPETAPVKDWNLIEATHVYDGPVGVRIGPQARHTILRSNAIHVDGDAVEDASGEGVAE